jgi:ABC-type bacteriocin/lantibiotic exporter with double-glycine peptidase domain
MGSEYNPFRLLRDALSRKKPQADSLPLTQTSPQAQKELIALIRQAILDRWKLALGAVLLLVATSLSVLPIPLISQHLIDRVLLARELKHLPLALGLLIFLKLFGQAGSIWQRFLFTRFEEGTRLQLQHQLIERTLKLPKAFFDQSSVGYLLSRIQGDSQGLRFFFSQTLVGGISALINLIGGSILLIHLHPPMALIAIGTFPFFFLTVHFFAKRFHILSHHSMEAGASIFRSLTQQLQRAPLLKAFAREKESAREMDRLNRQAARLTYEQTALGSAASLAIGIFPDLVRLLVYAWGGYLIIQGQWTLGSLMAFRTSLGMVFGPISMLGNLQNQYQTAKASFSRIAALYSISPEETETGEAISRINGPIVWDKVGFAYDPDKPVLDGVSCEIRPGERLGIVGASGVGKTTFISLLMGFYKPTSGRISINGLPLQDYRLDQLRLRFAWVSQQVHLFDGTVRENLSIVYPRATEEEIVTACRRASLHEEILTFNQGYDTPIGENGVRLSAGQQQRLSLARALLSDADVFLLDEFTSALDSENALTVLDTLGDRLSGKTVLVITHSAQVAEQMDRVLFLDQNRLTAQAPHRQLLEDPAYRRILMR